MSLMKLRRSLFRSISMSGTLLATSLLILVASAAQETSPQPAVPQVEQETPPDSSPSTIHEPVLPTQQQPQEADAPGQQNPSDVTSRVVPPSQCSSTTTIPVSCNIFPCLNPLAPCPYKKPLEPACIRLHNCLLHGWATYDKTLEGCNRIFASDRDAICEGTYWGSTGGTVAGCKSAASMFSFGMTYYRSSTSTYCPYAPNDENMKVFLMNTNGSVGPLVQRGLWSSGYTVVERYMVGAVPYIMYLKNTTGDIYSRPPKLLIPNDPLQHILGNQVVDQKWSGSSMSAPIKPSVNDYSGALAVVNYTIAMSDYNQALEKYRKGGWTAADFYTINGQTYLFFIKYENGSAKVIKVGPDGSFGPEIKYTWTSGWTHARAFSTSMGHFLFLLKSESGEVSIHPLNPTNGSVGTSIMRDNWASGWMPEFWQSGPNTYLFLIKPRTGEVKMYQMYPNGTVDGKAKRWEDNWSEGWTTAKFFNIGMTPHLFLLKSSNGIVKIYQMNSNGTKGLQVYEDNWKSGWTSAVFYQLANRTYLMLVKAWIGGYSYP